jgi:hypothetical protein
VGDKTGKKIPDFMIRSRGQKGKDAVIGANSVVIIGIVYLLGDYIPISWYFKVAGVFLLSYVVFVLFMAAVCYILQRIVGYTRGDSSINTGMFPTFVTKPPADLLTYDELRIMFYGEIIAAFVPCVLSAALIFVLINPWFIVATIAMVDFAFLFCFTEDGNLTRFGRANLIRKDYAAADNIARSIAIGYHLMQRERFSDMPKLLFVAPNEIIDMYDYRQSVFCYLRSMEIRDFKRAIILTERVIKSHYFEQLRGLALITERNAVLADQLISLMLVGDKESKKKASKLYWDNSYFITEWFSDNVVNMRYQTVQYGFAKLIAVNSEAQAKNANDRFWEATEGCNIAWIVSFYAGLILEIETTANAEKVT